MFSNEWLQLELLCDADQAESLGALLVEAGALGAEERPLTPQNPPPHLHIPPHLDTSASLLLIAYFEAGLDRTEQEAIAELTMAFGVPQEALIWAHLRDDGWSTRWQAFFKPLPVGQKLLICPTWEEPPPGHERHILWLDPGMAFGTGHHATTRGCLQFIDKLVTPEQELTLLDVGCGSGILCIAALLLGAKRAIGIDVDAEAITIAKENAEKNALLARCDFSTTPIAEVAETFPLIFANIQAHILIPMATEIVARLQPNAQLLLSGLWQDQHIQVCETYQQLGLIKTDSYEEDGWTTLLMLKPSH